VVIDPVIFMREIDKLAPFGVQCSDCLRISRKAHLILPTHRLLDAASEAAKGKSKIGSTLKGIGPTYMDKPGRNGLRVGDVELPDFMERYEALKAKHLHMMDGAEHAFDLGAAEAEWHAAMARLKELPLADTDILIQEAYRAGKRILAEGAQGTMLDVDFGTYPFVTSSTTTPEYRPGGHPLTSSGTTLGPSLVGYENEHRPTRTPSPHSEEQNEGAGSAFPS